MPYRRSKALSRIDSSLSSRHWRMRSLWDWTDLGCVFRILDIANSPRYFTAKDKIKLLSKYRNAGFCWAWNLNSTLKTSATVYNAPDTTTPSKVSGETAHCSEAAAVSPQRLVAQGFHEDKQHTYSSGQNLLSISLTSEHKAGRKDHGVLTASPKSLKVDCATNPSQAQRGTWMLALWFGIPDDREINTETRSRDSCEYFCIPRNAITQQLQGKASSAHKTPRYSCLGVSGQERQLLHKLQFHLP